MLIALLPPRAAADACAVAASRVAANLPKHPDDVPIDLGGSGGAIDVLVIAKRELQVAAETEGDPIRPLLIAGLEDFNEASGAPPITLEVYTARVDGPIGQAAATYMWDRHRDGMAVYSTNEVRAFARRNVARACRIINAVMRGEDTRAVAAADGGWLY